MTELRKYFLIVFAFLYLNNNGIVLSASTRTTSGSIIIEELCENSVKTIKCQNGARIEIQSASFGRRSKDVCSFNVSSNNLRNTACRATGSQTKVVSSCNGKHFCTLVSSTSIFGDPCPSTYKYLEVLYECRMEKPKEKKDMQTIISLLKDLVNITSKMSVAVDQLNNPAKPTCDDGWKLLGDKCFKHFATKKNWYESRAFCKTINGAKLAEPRSLETMKLMANYLVPLAGHTWVWVGGREWKNSCPTCQKSGMSVANRRQEWYWDSDESLISYDYWSPGQPDQPRDTCLIMWRPTPAPYVMGDGECAGTHEAWKKHLICEKDPVFKKYSFKL